ncbi:MAG: universal stress protein [Oricola sp.]
MKKILVATDLSARSDRALQRALALANEHKAELEVIHVVEDDLPQNVVDRNEEQAREALDEQIGALVNEGDAAVTRSVIRGQDFAEIIKRSIDSNADLLVLGVTRHRSRNLFRGTTSERVIRLGRVPVLVVKQPCAGPYSRVLVGVDLSVHSHRALEFAVGFAPAAEFYCVHASHEPFIGFLGKETREELVASEQKEFSGKLERDIADIVQKTGMAKDHIHTMMKTGDPQSVICESADEMDIDLIVTGTHGRPAVAQAFLGSIAEDCLAESDYDVLVAKAW